MTIQVKFLSLVNTLSRTVLTNGFRYNFPAFQQTAYLKQSLEEKLSIPPKPKRPLSAYFKFMADVRPKIVKELPNASVTEVVREIASRWEKADPKIKQKLEAEYKSQMEDYAKKKLQYDTNLTEEQKSALKQARIEITQEREKRKYRKKCREHKKPKRPASAFVLFMKSQIPNRGAKELGEWRKDVAAKWHLLTDEEKKPFFQQTHDEMREYHKNLVEWERKMIQMGHTDLVRQDSFIDTKTKQNTKRQSKKTE